MLKAKVETSGGEITGSWGNAWGSLYLLPREENPQPTLPVPDSTLLADIYLFTPKGSYKCHQASSFIIFSEKSEIKRVMICPKVTVIKKLNN